MCSSAHSSLILHVGLETYVFDWDVLQTGTLLETSFETTPDSYYRTLLRQSEPNLDVVTLTRVACRWRIRHDSGPVEHPLGSRVVHEAFYSLPQALGFENRTV